MGTAFAFAEFAPMSDGVVRVVVEERKPYDLGRGRVPAYECGIYQARGPVRVGAISVRVLSTPSIVMYAGHLGYDIEPEQRGHRYAARACRLVRPILRHHGLSVVWLTVNPENVASRRTCELIGAELVDVVQLPSDTDMYARGERQKCRYRWVLTW